MHDVSYFLWVLLITGASFEAWFFLNSRQWLLSLIWLPALLAAAAAYFEEWGFAVAVYFLTLSVMIFLPASGLFYLLTDIIMPGTADRRTMESWQDWDIKDMWRNPKSMRK